MRDYLLFIDTETTGLPLHWHRPYSDQENWPYAIQIAWVVYSQSGELIKKENHYLWEPDIVIPPKAFAIHGISADLLRQQGKSRQHIMGLLAGDLQTYTPLVVAHYMQLDYHMLGADFYRCGLPNPLEKLPLFCTMLATAPLVDKPRAKYLRLSRLYYSLFQRDMGNEHDALADAQATAACFFEMLRLNLISEKQILQQRPLFADEKNKSAKSGCILPLFAGVIFSLILSLWL
ncbi:MAG: exonuclease domain-containing protein [Adhaeribacter sp.]